MFCMACGTQVHPESKSCDTCSAPVENEPATAGTAELTPPGRIGNGATHVARSLSIAQIAMGLLIGGVGIWFVSGGMTSRQQSASATTGAGGNGVPQPAPEPQPVRTYYTLASDAPLCTSFKGAITAAAVMRAGNPVVIDAVLSRQGCETLPNSTILDPDARIQELQAGVVVIITPTGDRVYTTGSSLSSSRH
jgi:hypothetical protein